MIACQGRKGGWPFAAHKALDHLHGAKTAVDVIAQKHRQRVVEGPIFDIGRDPLSHLAEKVIATVDVAYAVHPHPIRDPSFLRSRDGCFFEPL